MEKVKFYLKRNTKNEIIVHSICRDTKSHKYLFPYPYRDVSYHCEGLRQKIKATLFTSKCHLDYTLKSDEKYMYINPKNKKFWFNQVELDSRPASKVTSQPSGKLL